MIFSPPLPWTKKIAEDLGRAAAQSDKMEIRWWWEPFHQRGMRALKFAARHKIPKEELQKILEDLSCPGASQDFIAKNGLQAFANENSALLPLDPQPAIKSTWFESGYNLSAFSGPDLFLPTIADLHEILGPAWTPVLPQEPSKTDSLSNGLTHSPRLLKRFQDLEPWQHLELVESVIGVYKSTSTLQFQRIYSL